MTMSAVDTDALRKHITLNGNSDKTIRRVFAAADELDRLRVMIENAPHGRACGWLYATSQPCTCWKADAL